MKGSRQAEGRQADSEQEPAQEGLRLSVTPGDDGRILCPNVREGGLPCGKFIGHHDGNAPRWFCPRCKAELRLSPAFLEAIVRTPNLYLQVRRASKRDLLQLYLLTDATAQADRSRVLDLIDSLPDDEADASSVG